MNAKTMMVKKADNGGKRVLAIAWLLAAGTLHADEARVRRYAEEFASLYPEHVTNAVPNAAAADFLVANVPFFECPDGQIERTYYFRWWTYRMHLFRELGGWCVSEFMDRRAISCPVGHHIREGRWLRDKSIIDDYTRYWFKKGARPIHGPGSYVNWIVRAVLWREEVTGDTALADGLLDDFVANYEAWERGWEARPWPKEGMYRMGLRGDGLFHDVDDREGTELTLSGNGARVHVNAIMYGEAKGIAKIAARCGRPDLAAAFEARAAKLEKLVKERLWNEELGFFTPRGDDGRLVPVCELHGYTPWLAGLPLDEPKYAAAWRYLTDEKGFRAKVGLTFPVQSAPGFRISYEGHGCQWNGPSWPFATSVALTALGDTLHAGAKLPIGRREWFDAFRRYSLQNRQTLKDGRTVPWIDEVQDPYTGNWIAYARWESRNYAYNHSTFCDLVISGLVGLKVAADGTVTADPFVPDDWSWFRLSNVPVRGRLVTVTYDRDGSRFGGAKGLTVAPTLALEGKDVVLQPKDVVDVVARCAGTAPVTLYRDGVRAGERKPDASGRVVFPGVRLNRGVTQVRVEADGAHDALSWRCGVTEGAAKDAVPKRFGNPKTKWFEDARFGLFIHWGIYSIPAKGEWFYVTGEMPEREYRALPQKFNPTDYDPRAWARLAKAAGMKYVVFTTRHHDGFCMFDSHFTDYKITKTPYGKDVLRMLCEAFRAEGLRIGFYHSLPDWTNAGYVDPETPVCLQTGKCAPYDAAKHAAYRKLVRNHVNQLTTEYGKIDILFFDYTSMYKNDVDYFGRKELMELCRRNQPDVIINDRLAYFKDGASPDFDYYTPEISVPTAAPLVRGTERPWETCATMNDHWGYASADRNFKSVETLVAGLVGCVSRNGNLLLNVGPDERGRFPAESVARLRELATWYRANGESVTGCGASAFTPPYGCVYTQRGRTLYLHVNVAPMGDVILPELFGKVGRMTLLRTGEAVASVDFWGFETLRPDDLRIRGGGLRVGDVVRIELKESGK